jgi:hypothetical protein
MPARTDITTGEQAVTTAGAVTGSLDTSALPAFNTVKVMVRGLSATKRALFAIEDTANASAFSDAIQVATFHFVGGGTVDGDSRERQSYDIPLTRFGVANSKLRLNCLAIDATPGTVLAHAWIE